MLPNFLPCDPTSALQMRFLKTIAIMDTNSKSDEVNTITLFIHRNLYFALRHADHDLRILRYNKTDANILFVYKLNYYKPLCIKLMLTNIDT